MAVDPGAPRYAVVGNPVAHSLSPQIHAAFARQTGAEIDYRRVLAPLDGFDEAVRRFVAEGGRGFNVTVPFKREAFVACGTRLSERALRAGAVNCVTVVDAGLAGDNTDGIGLVRDLARLLGGTRSLHDRRVLLIGAGGAARGVVGPLLDTGLRELFVVARDPGKGSALIANVARARACSFDSIGDAPFDVIVNATSASLVGELPPLPTSHLANAGLVYDMMYGPQPTTFMLAARAAGDAVVADGLGMLVEQAAASYDLWRGTRPDTAPVLLHLRALFGAAR